MTTERGANTPEPTGSGQDLATMSARFVALVVDWVACLVLSWLLGWAGVDGPEVLGADPLPVGLYVLYASIALAFGTQTIGMALLKITCVDARTGDRLPLWRSILRALLVPLLLPALAAFFHPYSRGLHDLAAGAVVLKAAPARA